MCTAIRRSGTWILIAIIWERTFMRLLRERLGWRGSWSGVSQVCRKGIWRARGLGVPAWRSWRAINRYRITGYWSLLSRRRSSRDSSVTSGFSRYADSSGIRKFEGCWATLANWWGLVSLLEICRFRACSRLSRIGSARYGKINAGKLLSEPCKPQGPKKLF